MSWRFGTWRGPGAQGARSATPSFADDAFDSPQTVTLSGTGITLADVIVAIAGSATAAPGSQDPYVLTVSNAGPSTAHAVTLDAKVPTGTTFVGVNTTQGTCTHPASGSTSGTIACSLGDLASGAAAIGTVTPKIVLTGTGGSIALAAQASSATTDPNLGIDVASLTTTVSKK